MAFLTLARLPSGLSALSRRMGAGDLNAIAMECTAERHVGPIDPAIGRACKVPAQSFHSSRLYSGNQTSTRAERGQRSSMAKTVFTSLGYFQAISVTLSSTSPRETSSDPAVDVRKNCHASGASAQGKQLPVLPSHRRPPQRQRNTAANPPPAPCGQGSFPCPCFQPVSFSPLPPPHCLAQRYPGPPPSVWQLSHRGFPSVWPRISRFSRLQGCCPTPVVHGPWQWPSTTSP